MNTRTSTLDAVVRAADPAADPDRRLDGRARTDLERILASPASTAPGRRARPGLRRLVLATTAVLAVIGLVAGAVAVRYEQRRRFRAEMSTTGLAVTPAILMTRPLTMGVDAGTVLRGIAERSAALPDDTGTGPYAYTEKRDWSLWTEVDGVRVTSMVVPQELSMWRAADGSGRDRRVYRWPSGDTDVGDESVGPGTLSAGWPLGSLSDDDARLADQLAIGHPREHGPAERLVAIADAYRLMPIPPKVRAAMLRFLAATDGLAFDGEVTDRVGRTGVAVSVESAYAGLPTRYTLIVDPGTGHVLGWEEMLTRDAGRLNVAVPSVISYTAFVSARYTDSTG